MICIIALIVFSIMGIFSASQRKIAIQAFDCVFRRLTLRKCQSGLDIQLKSQLVGKILNKSPKAAKFTFKYFEVISWIFVILTIGSMILTVQSGYNYYLYGNCNGPESDAFCIFDPLGEHSKFSDTSLTQSLSSDCTCALPTATEPKKLSLENINLNLFFNYSKEAENNVLFIGCYSCPYTREAYNTIKKLMNRDDVNAIFAHFPVKDHSEALSRYAICVYEQDKNKLLEFNDILFDTDPELFKDENNIKEIVNKLELDQTKLDQCLISDKTKQLEQKQIDEIKKIGVYGTPTVFVNQEPIVGPKQYRVYTRLLK